MNLNALYLDNHSVLKGHSMQHSGHMGKKIQAEKTIEIQLVRPTVVCGEVLSEKNGQKCVKGSLLLSNVIDVCLQTKAIFHHLYGF